MKLISPPLNCASHRALRASALICAALALPACGSFQGAPQGVASLISPYKMDVVQGNFVSKEQLSVLEVGMPREQVRNILGSPLVSSVFHADRWEYVFTIKRQGQEAQQRRLSLVFKGNELASIDSDALISEEEFVNSLSPALRLGKVPDLEASEKKLQEAKTAASGAAATAPQVVQPMTAASKTYPPLEATAR
jgi:outer membrane protein assembly factor BamE